jgi:tetratricopeptide (TPR) repeat protein
MAEFYEKLANKGMSRLKKDFKNAGYLYSSAADYYLVEGDEEKFRGLKDLALKCFSSYLEESQKGKMRTDTCQVYLWISGIYKSLGQLDEFRNFAIKAAEAFTLSADILVKNDKTLLQAIICYYNSANCYRLAGDKKTFIKKYGKALSVYHNKGKNRGIELSPVLLASCYYRMGENKRAIDTLEQELKNENLSPLVFSNIHLILGCYYLENMDKEKAKEHFEDAKASPDAEKLSAIELVTQALCQLMLNNKENAIGIAELSAKLSSKMRDYDLRQLIQGIEGIVLYLAEGKRSTVEKIIDSLEWQHFALPLYDALKIITENLIGKH